MKQFFRGRKIALILVAIMLLGVSTAFAAEDAVKVALNDFYALMQSNKTTSDLNTLTVKVLENTKAEADKEAAKIFATGVYEQGYDNTITKIIAPQEAASKIVQEKMSQEAAPLQREGSLYKALQAYKLLQQQKILDTKLLGLTREEAAMSKVRYDAGVISEADYIDKQITVEAAVLGLDQLNLSLASAALEVNRLAGTEFDTMPDAGTSEIAPLPSSFADNTKKTDWLASAIKADSGIFQQTENLRFMDLRIKTAKDFIPDTHSRVIEMKRDREDARLSLEDSKTGVEVNLLNKLNEMATALDKLTLSKKDLEMAKRRMAQAKIRLDAGIYGRADMIGQERAVLQVEFDIVNKTAAINSIEVDLRMLVGVKVTAE